MYDDVDSIRILISMIFDTFTDLKRDRIEIIVVECRQIRTDMSVFEQCLPYRELGLDKGRTNVLSKPF